MAKPSQHLTYEQRCQIYALKQRDFSQAESGKALGVSQGTISRALRRHRGFRGYRFQQAQGFAAGRCSGWKRVARVMPPVLLARVERLLVGRQWSPEQMAGCVRKTVHRGAMRALTSTSGRTNVGVASSPRTSASVARRGTSAAASTRAGG